MKNKHIKSFFDGIEEGLHWTPVGLVTVPLWASRKRRSNFWIKMNAITVAASVWFTLFFAVYRIMNLIF